MSGVGYLKVFLKKNGKSCQKQWWVIFRGRGISRDFTVDVFPISSIYALYVLKSALFSVRSMIGSTNARKSGINMLRDRIDTNHG